MDSLISISQAVEAIKTAILQGQYEAVKDVNRVQLAVYFAIGKYLSKNNKRFDYGTKTMQKISERLHKELPGLRGFSTSLLYEMRKFYESWSFMDIDFPTAIGKSEIEAETNFPIAIGKSQTADNQIDIYNSIKIPNITNFPVEDFFKVPFTHHIRIMTMCKTLPARYYYLHRTAEEHLSAEALVTLIRQQEYDSPMGVATYTTANDMPEKLRNALPDENKLKELLSGNNEQE